jgi:hypothetical protein
MGEKNILEWKIKCNYLGPQVRAADSLMLKLNRTVPKYAYIRQWVKRLMWIRKEGTVNKFMTIPDYL